MRSWLRRRRERLERAEADAVILDLGATAYSQAPRREHEASSNAMAREWNRVALAVARKTGQTVGLNASTRIAMDAKPVAQFRIQFFGVPTDRAPTILGEETCWLWTRSQRYAKRLRLHGLLARLDSARSIAKAAQSSDGGRPIAGRRHACSSLRGHQGGAVGADIGGMPAVNCDLI